MLGRSKALAGVSGDASALHSLPGYYGHYTAIWCGVPALMILVIWSVFENTIITGLVQAGLPDDLATLPADQMSLLMTNVQNVASGNIVSKASPEVTAAAEHYLRLSAISTWSLTALALAAALVGLWYAFRRIQPQFRSRERVERVIMVLMIAASSIAVITTIGIILSLIFETFRFFTKVPFTEFLFGLSWSPQLAIRADQVGSSGAFGAIPVFAGTLLITVIAMIVAVPVGLLSAVYMAEYANPRFRAVAKPLLEI
ncbi:MAG: PstC family ABC transporter permease, partial [Alphaproteobacteria bacterium]